MTTEPGTVTRRAVRCLAPPLLVFVVSRGVVLLAAWTANIDPASTDIWLRSDARYYVSIAQSGYTLNPCGEESAYGAEQWCGNAGWFPAYPLLIRGLATFMGSRAREAAIDLAAFFLLATLALVWAGFLRTEMRVRNILLLLLAGLFFGQVYYHAAFPISQCLFFTMLLVYLAQRDRYWAAAAAGCAASFSYPTALVLAPALAIWSLLTAKRPRLVRALVGGLLTASGFAAVLVVHHYAVGSWDAFFKIQRRYQHRMTSPLASLLARVAPLTRPETWWKNDDRLFALRAAGGGYVSAKGGGGGRIAADAATPGPWETFRVHLLPEGRVALQTNKGHFVAVARGVVTATGRGIDEAEALTPITMADGKLALKTHDLWFLRAEGGGGRRLLADRKKAGPWEAFDVRHQPGRSYRLRLESLQSLLAALLVILAVVLPVLHWRTLVEHPHQALGRAPATPSRILFLESKLRSWARRWRAIVRQPLPRSELLPMLITLAFFTFPLAMGAGVTSWRAETLLLPLVLLLRRLPAAVLAGLVAMLALLSFQLAGVYVRL